jgi:hypothetical protein
MERIDINNGRRLVYHVKYRSAARIKAPLDKGPVRRLKPKE